MNTTPVPPAVATPAVAWIGLDISQGTLDACLLRPPNLANGSRQERHEKQFANTASGHAKLLRWARQAVPDTNLHCCLEATGPYSQAVANFLLAQTEAVSVINPARIRFFTLAQNAGNKTDKADARLIARYRQQQKSPLWRAVATQVQQLQALTRRWHALSELCVQEKNRLAVPGQDKVVTASSKRVLTALEREMRRLQYAGLAPREPQSGKSVHKPTHLSKRGNSRLRKAFYFPAVSALTWNLLVKAHYQRLIAQGKPKMVALAACMRKLLMLCYGGLKHQRSFDPHWLGHDPATSKEESKNKNSKELIYPLPS